MKLYFDWILQHFKKQKKPRILVCKICCSKFETGKECYDQVFCKLCFKKYLSGIGIDDQFEELHLAGNNIP